jgi:8-oxo-dGTP diphosphatase
MEHKDGDVVVILPYRNNKILMQLRDEKEFIRYPGKWGFFSGEIKPNEQPISAALRELEEETGIKPDNFLYFYKEKIPEHNNITSFSYYTILNGNYQINLREGQDYGFFSIKQIASGTLYSNKHEKNFPVIENPILMNTVRALDKILNLS